VQAARNFIAQNEKDCRTQFKRMDSVPEGTTLATEQFEVADERSPAEFAETIRRLGYEPVWKDWDTALGEAPP
jgi:hypothetical protein